jgi:chorismate synthase
MISFVVADALIEKLGGDSILEMKPRFGSLRKAELDDLSMDNTRHVFWPSEE